MFKKMFLPVGLLLSVIISMIFPQLGTQVKQIFGSSLFIVLIFLVCGYQTDFSGTKFNKSFLLSFLVCGILSLLAAPWLGVGIAKVFQLDKLAMTGLIVMACVPPTLSSGIVMTETAEGNIMLGVMMTVFYNLLGVLTMPLVVTWTLASKTDIDTNPLKMFIQLLLLVVLPFAVGFGLKKLLKRKLPSFCGYIPSACVILLILSFFSSANAQFKAYPVKFLLLIAAAGLLMRVGLMLMLWFGGVFTKMNLTDRKAAIFTAGSKTLTIALAILAILDVGNGPAVIPCMVFYFLQSMIDSALAGKMGLSAAKKREIKNA